MATVLLVHANSDDREMYADYLRLQGFEVTQAETTDAALPLVPRCDLMITGLMVPGTFDGIALIARVRQDNGRIPIIVLTATALNGAQQAAVSAGCDEFLAKPCYPEDLLSSVSRLLESARRTESVGPRPA